LKEDKLITTTEIAIILNISRRTVARIIKTMKDDNKIKRVGPDKGGFWEVIK